jgi:hypothetical protein
MVCRQAIQEEGSLSDAQLETIVYANMRFNTTVDGGGTFSNHFNCTCDAYKISAQPEGFFEFVIF